MSISTTLINPKNAHRMITDQSIKFASRYENLAIAEKLINDVSEQYQLPEDYYGNIEKIPDPTDPANIEKINGRGVFLMRNLADHVSFSDNGKIVQLDFEMEPIMVG